MQTQNFPDYVFYSENPPGSDGSLTSIGKNEEVKKNQSSEV